MTTHSTRTHVYRLTITGVDGVCVVAIQADNKVEVKQFLIAYDHEGAGLRMEIMPLMGDRVTSVLEGEDVYRFLGEKAGE